MNESRFLDVLLAVFFGLWLFALSLVAVLKITDTAYDALLLESLGELGTVSQAACWLRRRRSLARSRSDSPAHTPCTGSFVDMT